MVEAGLILSFCAMPLLFAFISVSHSYCSSRCDWLKFSVVTMIEVVVIISMLLMKAIMSMVVTTLMMILLVAAEERRRR